MPRPDPPDEQVTARLAGLDLAAGARGGWVPAQPELPASDLAAREPLPDWVPPWVRDLSVTASPAAVLALAAVCAGCVAVTGYLLLHRPAAAVPEALPTTTMTQPLPTAAASPAGIVVDVGGRVRRPGLVTLPAGARVADALHAAGGALRHRDVATLNLAARVADGQLLLVGTSGAAAAAGAAGAGAGVGGAAAPAAPVDLNTATLDQLDTLPGIGPVLAQRIIDWRSAHGGFGSVADLNDVSGIGESTFADISPLVTV